MKSMMLVAISLLALAACTETRFQSPPGTQIESCDPDWKGLWVSEADSSASEPDELAFLVDQDCRFLFLERPEKDAPPKQIHIPINFVHDRGKHYLVIADNQLAGLVDLDPVHGITPPPEKSFFLARYQRSGDRLRIFQVDSRKAARLVIDKALEGTVDSSANELHVYIKGSPQEVLEMLRKQDLFEDKSDTVVKRSTLDLDEYERQRRARRTGNPS